MGKREMTARFISSLSLNPPALVTLDSRGEAGHGVLPDLIRADNRLTDPDSLSHSSFGGRRSTLFDNVV